MITFQSSQKTYMQSLCFVKRPPKFQLYFYFLFTGLKAM